MNRGPLKSSRAKVLVDGRMVQMTEYSHPQIRKELSFSERIAQLGKVGTSFPMLV